MQDLVISFGVWWAIIAVFCGAAFISKKAEIRLVWFIVAIILFGLSFAGNVLGDALIPEETLLTNVGWEWNWNWSGKFGEIFVTLLSATIICVMAKRAKFADLGFTFKQKKGSIRPALIMTGGLIAIGLVLNYLFSNQTPTKIIDVEQLFYQASMPGLSEEIFFRGLLLFAFMRALPSKSLNIASVPVHFGGFITIVIFTIGHSIFFTDGGLQFSGIAFFYSAIMAAGLLWIRLRTGSILIPIIAHNLVNTSTTFAGFFI